MGNSTHLETEGVRRPERRTNAPEAEGERPDLNVEQILAWADAYHAAHGDWPNVRLMAGLGPVEGVPGETWKGINFALALGRRGLPGDSSLGELLAAERGVPADLSPQALAGKLWAWEQEHFPVKKPRLRPAKKNPCPGLTESAILAWADAHHAATGDWPNSKSGTVRDAPFEVTWAKVESALRSGVRGLPGGSSLARLLAEHRGARNRKALEPLTIEQILAWADAHHAATGAWPQMKSGTVRDAPYDITWYAIYTALYQGSRGLPGGSSLGRLLAAERGARSGLNLPPLSIEQVLAWADAHRAATGAWPTMTSGTVRDAPFAITWGAVENALCKGTRGLARGSSLARLFAEEREARNKCSMQPLTIEQVLAWADAHLAATGTWPGFDSGPVLAAPGERWDWINRNLSLGQRGLPGGTSLLRLLTAHRGVYTAYSPKPLSIEQILAWADAYHVAHGCWPGARSGPIEQAPGETWLDIDRALRRGSRGLVGGRTLASLRLEHRGPEAHNRGPRLNVEQVLAWADAHHAATGTWPTPTSGKILAAPAESWASIQQSLLMGHRGLPGGSSLIRLLEEHRGVWNRGSKLPLTEEQILAWADAYHAAHGRWPDPKSGPVAGVPHQTWGAVHQALQAGSRGLAGGSSLPGFLAAHREVERCFRRGASDEKGTRPDLDAAKTPIIPGGIRWDNGADGSAFTQR